MIHSTPAELPAAHSRALVLPVRACVGDEGLPLSCLSVADGALLFCLWLSFVVVDVAVKKIQSGWLATTGRGSGELWPRQRASQLHCGLDFPSRATDHRKAQAAAPTPSPIAECSGMPSLPSITALTAVHCIPIPPLPFAPPASAPPCHPRPRVRALPRLLRRPEPCNLTSRPPPCRPLVCLPALL